MFVFRYIVIVNLVVVKRLGIAGMVFSICPGEKCGSVLFVYFWLVIELGFQFFMKWYLLLFVWRGR
jgi:hypothetical protein